MKKLFLLFLCTDILLIGMYGETTEELTEESVEESEQPKFPSLRELSLQVLLKQNPQTSGHKLHGLDAICASVLQHKFGICLPEWGLERLIEYAKKAEALSVASEVERAATFLADFFDFESDNGFDSVDAKVKLFNALDTLPPNIRDAISTKRTTMSLKKRKFK